MIQPLVISRPLDAGEIENRNGLLWAPPPACDRCHGVYAPSSCLCAAERRKRECFNRATLPARYATATLETLTTCTSASPSLQRLHRWIVAWSVASPAPREGILISGPCGIGKTHSCIALLRHLTLVQAISCRFMDWKVFLTTLKAAYEHNGSACDLLHSLTTCQVLVLDDVGPVRGSDWERDVFDEVISRRYSADLPAFITTNLTLDANPKGTSAFERWVQIHTTSRLHEICHWLSADGRDRRKPVIQYLREHY